MAFFNDILENEINSPAYKTDDLMIVNDDCMNLLKSMKNESVDCFVSDVPYRVSAGGGGMTRNGKKYMSRNPLSSC